VVDECEINGARHIVVRFDGVVVMPYVRQTRRSRFRRDRAGDRAREYNELRASLRDALALILKMRRIEAFGKVRLGFSGLFWDEKVSRKDIDNLVKAAMDVCSDILIPDDCWVYRLGECEKNPGRPAMVLKFWEVKSATHQQK